MKKKSFCLDKICSLYKEWQYLSNNHKKCSKIRIEKFQKDLENTCNLVGKNAIHEITTDKCRDAKRKAEDISFLKDQISERKAKFWTHDSVYDSKICAKQVKTVS